MCHTSTDVPIYEPPSKQIFPMCPVCHKSTDVHSAPIKEPPSKQVVPMCQFNGPQLGVLVPFQCSSDPVISKDTPSSGLNGTGCIKGDEILSGRRKTGD